MKSFTFWHFWADTKESVVDARDCRQWLIDPDFFCSFSGQCFGFRWICHSYVGLFCLRRFCFRARFFHQRFHCIIVCDEKPKPSQNKQLIQRQIKIYSQQIFASLHKSRKTFIYTYTKDLVERVFSINFTFMEFVIIYPWNIRAYNVTWIIGHDFSEFFHWIEIMFQSIFGLSG